MAALDVDRGADDRGGLGGAELLLRAGDAAGAGAAFEATAEAWEASGGARSRLAVLWGNAAACYARAGDAEAAARMSAKKEVIAP